MRRGAGECLAVGSTDLLAPVTHEPYGPCVHREGETTLNFDDALSRGLIDSIPDALVVTDVDGRIVFVNASCEAMFLYARAELISQPIELLVPEHRRSAHRLAREGFSRAPVARPMGTGTVLTGRRKDGTELPIDVSLGTLPSAKGPLSFAVVRDATTRRQAEESLRQSEQRYRELFESAPDGIFMATQDGRYTDVNAAGCRLLGYAREELVGRSITEFVSPDAHPRQSTLARHILEGGAEVSEWELRRKDGTFVPVELSSNALPDRHLRGFARDISERRRASEALRRNEESLARAQRVAHVGSFDWDLRANTAYRSAELCALFGLGFEGETAPPWSLSEMFHPDDREKVVQLIRDAQREGRSYRVEHRIVRHDGSERVVLHQGEVVLEEGCAVRMVGTLLDITDRRRIESEREQSLRQLEAVLDQCPVGIVLARGPNAEHLQLNARAQALVGRPIDHVGQYPNILLTPDERPIEAEEHPTLRALRGERFDSTEFLLQQADGSRIPVSMGGAPVPDASGAVPRAVVTIHDISAAKHLERVRSEWSAIVAHDLRQPLNGIALHAAVIARALARDPSATGRALESAETIVRSTDRLSRMISDLLDLSQLDARRVALSRCPTDLAALVRAVVEPLRLAEKGPSIEVRVDGEIPFLSVDPDRISQVIENLISNAMKYGTANAPIVVEAGTLADRAYVAVTNEGPGITPEDLPRLFSRFVRTEDVKRRSVKGIGLGLYICRELIAAHGGEITAESVPGGRTVFRFSLPVRASGLHCLTE